MNLGEPTLLVAVRILMLAACLPLLLPSGFCLCKLGLEHHPATEPAHDRDSHAPGCPGSHGADQLKWIEPASTHVIDLPLVEMFALESHPAFASVAAPHECEGPWPSAPPLFVSQCTFVC